MARRESWVAKPDLHPEVKQVVEAHALAITQKVQEAQKTGAPFPGEDIRAIVNESVSDGTVAYLGFYLAKAYDVVLRKYCAARGDR